MKLIRTYHAYLLLLAVVSIFATCSKDKRELPPMNPTYAYRDKNPIGGNIAYRLLPGQFNADISLASKKMKGIVNEFAYVKGSAYICIGNRMVLESEELEQLLNYVERGNEFFISAGYIEHTLLDTLGVKHNEEMRDAYDTASMRNTSVRIADTERFGKNEYGFFYYPFRSIYSGYDTATTKVLGVNEHGKANYLVVKYGKGKFYFHSEPDAFSNYFLLTGNNTNYYSQVFSYLNKNATAVYWADVYRFGKKSDEFSALSIFWKNPPLKYALLLACALMLFYIAFESKRKRRLVPPAVPNNNDSISFVHTISNLYLQKKDNRNIALKMITYFLEHIRSSYYLHTNTINTEFIQSLSRKSGVEETRVQELFEKVAYINEVESISDHELFELNNLIYEFYKR